MTNDDKFVPRLTHKDGHMLFALQANVMLCTLTLKCQAAMEVRLKQQPSQAPVAI